MAKLPKGYSGWKPSRKSRYWGERRKQRKALLNPQQPLSGNNLLAAAKAQVDLETKPQISALDTQARSARIQQGALASRSGGYYQQLAQEAMGQIGRVQATRAATGQAISGVNSAAQQAMDRTQAIADQSQARDVGVRGPGLSGGGDERVRQELAAARTRSAEIGQSAGANAENIGANWEGYARQMATASQMRGGEVQERLLNRLSNELSDIRTKKADILSMVGPKQTDALTKLRQQAFENAATASTLGQKQLALKYQAEADAADRALAQSRIDVTRENNKTTAELARDRINQQESASRRSARTQHRGQDVTKRGQDLSHQDRVAAQKKKAAEKKAGAKQPEGAQKARMRIGNLAQIYRDRWDRGKGDSLTDIAGDLRKDKNPPLDVRIASALGTRGYLTKADVQLLKSTYPGIQIPGAWTKKPARRTGFGPH